MPAPLRIATRESPLALWQSGHVRDQLIAAHPGLRVELLPMTTRGDQLLSHSLSRVGGKGLFVKELEQALLDGRADLAVHSMKDMPAQWPEALAVPCLLASHDPRDALVSNAHSSLQALPEGARVGTASLRRQALLKGLRPDLRVEDLRGNVNTRLARLDAGDFDAIVLACAGLERLGLSARIAEALPVDRFLPAPAQGVIGVQCRADDHRTRERLAPLHDAGSATRLAAERALSARLGGACHVPVAGHARADGEHLRLEALVARPDGSRTVRDRIDGAAADAAALGIALADRLLDAGGREILAELEVQA